jgi:hypothetical protein
MQFKQVNDMEAVKERPQVRMHPGSASPCFGFSYFISSEPERIVEEQEEILSGLSSENSGHIQIALSDFPAAYAQRQLWLSAAH